MMNVGRAHGEVESKTTGRNRLSVAIHNYKSRHVLLQMKTAQACSLNDDWVLDRPAPSRVAVREAFTLNQRSRSRRGWRPCRLSR